MQQPETRYTWQETQAESMAPEMHQVGQHGYVRISSDAPALELPADAPDQDGEVLAFLSADSGNNGYADFKPEARLAVVRSADGSINFRAETQYGYTLGESHPNNKPRSKLTKVTTPTGAPDVNVVFTAPHGKKGSQDLYITPVSSAGNFLRVITAPDAAEFSAPAQRISSILEQNSRKAAQKISRRVAGVVLAATIVVGGAREANATGGFYDDLRDANDSAGTSLLNEFGASPEAQRVARTIQDLDDHNLTAIHARAEEFQRAYADQLMPESQIEDTQTRIESARSHQEVVAIIDEFMSYYGKTAGLQETANGRTAIFNTEAVSLHLLQQYALGAVDAYSIIPKESLEKADFGRYEFSGPVYLGAGSIDRAGEYDPNGETKSIRIVVYDQVGGADANRTWAAHVSKHEYYHAVDFSDDGQFLSGPRVSQENPLQTNVRWLFDNPLEVSKYAAEESDSEKYAEANAYAADLPARNRLAHPDTFRLFNSDANKKLLEALVGQERLTPGIIDWIVIHSGVADRHDASSSELGE